MEQLVAPAGVAGAAGAGAGAGTGTGAGATAGTAEEALDAPDAGPSANEPPAPAPAPEPEPYIPEFPDPDDEELAGTAAALEEPHPEPFGGASFAFGAIWTYLPGLGN